MCVSVCPRNLMKWRHLLNVITTKLVIIISQIDVASAVFDRKSYSDPRISSDRRNRSRRNRSFHCSVCSVSLFYTANYRY